MSSKKDQLKRIVQKYRARTQKNGTFLEQSPKFDMKDRKKLARDIAEFIGWQVDPKIPILVTREEISIDSNDEVKQEFEFSIFDGTVSTILKCSLSKEGKLTDVSRTLEVIPDFRN